MHEVDAFPDEVVERVEFPLPGTPVELMNPVGNEVSQPVQFGALFPAYAGYLVGPSCMVQPRPQIVEHFIRDVNPKRFHYNNSLLAIACGHLNGSFANESTGSYEMDMLARVSLG
jgi:hypothetical protein